MKEGSSQLLFYSFTVRKEDTAFGTEVRACVRACKTNGKQQNITYIHPSDQACCSAQERREAGQERKEASGGVAFPDQKIASLLFFTCLKYPPTVATKHCVIVPVLVQKRNP